MMEAMIKGRAMVRGWAAAAGMAMGVIAFAAAAEEAVTVDGLPVERVEKIVRDYLMREPEIIYQALEELQKRQVEEQSQRQKETLVSRKDDLLNSPADPVAGNLDGDVTLVEFFDYRCAYCRRVLPEMQALMEDDKNLRVVFKEFPILGEDSVRAARASLASRKQDAGRYLDFHLALMTADDLTLAGIRASATEIGLDPDQLELDMKSAEITKVINANYELASALGIEGTPAFVIGDELVPGAVDKARLAQLVAKARAAATN